MNRLHSDDDFFSPVRFDSSAVDFSLNSEGSLSDKSNCDSRFSFPNTSIKDTLEDIAISQRQNQDVNFSNQDINSSNQNDLLETNDSVFTYTPVSNKNASSSLNRKLHFSNFKKIKFDEAKNLKDGKVLEKENTLKNVEYLQKQKHKTKEIVVDCKVSKLNPKQNDSSKRSTFSTSLSSNTESVELNDVKSDKIEKKKTNKSSSNNICSNDVGKLGPKCSVEKKLIANSLDFKKNVNKLPLKDASEKHDDSKVVLSTVLDSVVVESSSVTQDMENKNIAAPQPIPQYEASIEKIVHDAISIECGKIRQNIYLQQMSFFRQLNKMKDEMEQQHQKTTEHLFKIIEDLMQMRETIKTFNTKR